MLEKSQKNDLDWGGCHFKIHRVLLAMFHHALPCGGEPSRRYTASMISGCRVYEKDEETLTLLHDLGKTWISHFLFIFTANRSHFTQENKMPSGIATPTREDTASIVDKGARASRKTEFKDDLLKRDGYRCVLSKIADRSHPLYKNWDRKKPKPEPLLTLEGCHIIRRAIAVFYSKEDSAPYQSAVTTMDILRNYADLPEGTMIELADLIDDASNGFLLQKDAHCSFDKFGWCLEPTETANAYQLKVYDFAESGFGVWGWKKNDPRIITFVDHSKEFEASKLLSLRKRPHALATSLPNPKFLAIHAAIAGILHMSEAGNFLDKLFEKYPLDNITGPVTWERFEECMKLAEFRELLQLQTNNISDRIQ